MSAVLDTEIGQGVDETIVAGLITMLDKTSAVAQAFRMARDWCHSYESVNFELRLLSERTSAGQYKALKISEVATLITNDFGDGLPSRDIVVDSKDGEKTGSMKRFTNRGTRKANRGFVSMKQYYAYVIQQQNGHEISEMLAFIPGQKPYECPEVGTRVFKLKLTLLLDDLTKNEIFGKTYAEWKCQIPNQVDDIISTELPSPTTDLKGYKVVTEFMLHGPCGKGAACTVEGKCSKKYPKPFYSETNQDEDGYPVYRRRDSKVLARNGRSLADFQELPRPNPVLLTNMENQLIKEALDFDIKKSKIEHDQLHSLLNPKQRVIYDHVIQSVHNQTGQFYFVYGPGGTGKTFLYKTIITRLRSEHMIVLTVASSGIASLLLPGGRTAHSRFAIPLELVLFIKEIYTILEFSTSKLKS
ncbi:ATP-dependent DNA helicase PIF1-like protein [Tanacetum coccineum]